MLFTDPVFLFAFLPFTLLVFHLGRKYIGGSFAVWFLLATSVAFYGYWSVKYLFLLVAQILVNYLFVTLLRKNDSRWLLWLAIATNLILLGYFKYRNFFLENVGFLTGWQFQLSAVFVPLGISFHTFQQITFLIEVADGEHDELPLPQYILFVLFFPQLIAGPIVLHREMGDQLGKLSRNELPYQQGFGPGFAIFCLGLFKKVCLADNLAPYVDIAFGWPQHLQFLEAWSAVTGYALQLYFDFSGYSEMAVGLSLMLGMMLPFNFNNPLSATSIISYWNRWHITMTRFFTDYCYTPLAFNAHRTCAQRELRQPWVFMLTVAIPTVVTFLAAGLWHGAGWNFVIFGLINGVGLAINQAYRALKLPALPMVLCWMLTALVVLVGHAYFRSGSIEQAHAILHAMFVPDHFFVLPLWAESFAKPLGIPVAFFDVFQASNFTANFVGLMVLLSVMAALIPNIVARPFTIAPSYRTALALALMLWLTAGWIGEQRTFLYFQF